MDRTSTNLQDILLIVILIIMIILSIIIIVHLVKDLYCRIGEYIKDKQRAKHKELQEQIASTVYHTLDNQEKKQFILYLCDPSKNIDCSKTQCHLNGGPCKFTDKIAYAKNFMRKSHGNTTIKIYEETPSSYVPELYWSYLQCLNMNSKKNEKKDEEE